MTGDQYAVVLVYSTSHALRAEKVLAGAEIPCKLIPVPRHISSNCGICVRVRQDDHKSARQALEDAGVEIEGIYPI
jgi:hypothetical protein